MKYKVSEIAKLFNISVRTVHYYDEIDLIKPSIIGENGYRYYDNNDLILFEEVLFYKALDIPLKDIKEIMTSNSYTKEEILKKHKDLLI